MWGRVKEGSSLVLRSSWQQLTFSTWKVPLALHFSLFFVSLSELGFSHFSSRALRVPLIAAASALYCSLEASAIYCSLYHELGLNFNE